MGTDTELVDREVPKKPFFSVAEAAAATGFSRDFLAKQVREGALRALQVNANTSGSRLRIPRTALVEWLAAMVR